VTYDPARAAPEADEIARLTKSFVGMGLQVSVAAGPSEFDLTIADWDGHEWPIDVKVPNVRNVNVAVSKAVGRRHDQRLARGKDTWIMALIGGRRHIARWSQVERHRQEGPPPRAGSGGSGDPYWLLMGEEFELWK